ncbi:hypothetical protein [Pelagibacterium lentulum]|nr:hypothetical protein [Pelagibacterium lentulum]
MIKIKRLFLPFAAVSVLALAACDNQTQAPGVVDPDAGTPPAAETTPDETPASVEVETQAPADLQRQIDAVQEEAQETFQDIQQQSQQAGESLMDAGSNMMDAMTQQMQAAGDSLSAQIDAIVESAEEFRDDNMTDEQKLEVVANARVAAEQAARGLGRTEAEVIAAGDEAELRVRQALDI